MQNDGTNRDLENTRRDLIALRTKHGADSPIGHRCSNIIELIQAPVVDPIHRRTATDLIQKQMSDLQRLLAASQ